MTIHKEKPIGKLVVIEGIDGSGKDTQADLLVSNYWYNKTRLPIYEYETGKIIRRHIDNNKQDCTEEEFQSLMLCNYLEHYNKFIRPNLEAGNNIVMTRYTPSMIAYSKSFWIDQVFARWLLLCLERYIDDNIQIHKILLDLPVEISLERISKRDKETSQKTETIFENEKTLSEVSRTYRECRMFDEIIDANDSIENIHLKISDYLWEDLL